MQNEILVSTNNVLNGGTIEVFKIEGFFYVKSVVAGITKFSECVSEFKANYFVFDATHYGNLEF